MSINPANEIDVGKIKLVWRGTYAGATAYTIDDVVLHDDGDTSSAYICVADSTGNAPSTSGTVNTTYWNTLAQGANGVSGGTADGQLQFKKSTGFGATTALIYNTTTNRLGVGATDPARTLDVSGTSKISDIIISSGITTLSGATNITNTLEIDERVKQKVEITAGAANATANLDILTASTFLFTTNSGATWTHNIRGDGSTTLNSIMSTGQKITVTVISAQNNSSYYSANITIDGSAVTEYWQYGSTPSTGGSSGYDMYSWVITKTGSDAYVVIASQNNQV
jgi:hypothetical protein